LAKGHYFVLLRILYKGFCCVKQTSQDKYGIIVDIKNWESNLLNTKVAKDVTKEHKGKRKDAFDFSAATVMKHGK
jgi:hypothetical protein